MGDKTNNKNPTENPDEVSLETPLDFHSSPSLEIY